PEQAGVTERLLERLVGLRADAARRAQVFEQAGGPDTLLHGDLWTINAFVAPTAGGLRAQLVDWDRVGVGPFSYDLSAFLLRFPPEARALIPGPAAAQVGANTDRAAPRRTARTSSNRAASSAAPRLRAWTSRTPG